MTFEEIKNVLGTPEFEGLGYDGDFNELVYNFNGVYLGFYSNLDNSKSISGYIRLF